ncbi:MAG: monovalent cation/H(+) antiporter subunit G [Eubacterium sp.]|nr:monovalent cation/H(+) antiporter subunit G [Eubacterium sp.]
MLENAGVIIGMILIVLGLLFFVTEMIGVFKFKYVLNRMHAAAIGDTLGIGIILLGLILIEGISFTSLKIALVIIFLWLASPVSSHLISRLELTTDENGDEHYEKIEVKE